MLRTIPGADISLPSYLPKFGMLMLPHERPLKEGYGTVRCLTITLG